MSNIILIILVISFLLGLIVISFLAFQSDMKEENAYYNAKAHIDELREKRMKDE